MKEQFQIKLPDNINGIASYRTEKLDDLLNILYADSQILGILLGGSLSYKKDVSKSDIDLFCLVEQRKIFEKNLNRLLSSLGDIDVVIFQGYFPWTENLYTIYFKSDPDFSIDLCLIDSKKADTFFWEPNGHLLFDKASIIEAERINQTVNPGFNKQPFLKANPFSFAVISVKKIEKNLSRNHLWNAIEQLNSLRRYIMQIIRQNILNDFNFLGRVDRDIEDVISPEMNSKLIKSIANYEASDIAKKSVSLINLLLEFDNLIEETNEIEFRGWIIKQLKHEKTKLSKYF